MAAHTSRFPQLQTYWHTECQDRPSIQNIQVFSGTPSIQLSALKRILLRLANNKCLGNAKKLGQLR